MGWQETYEKWTKHSALNEDLRKQLDDLQGNEKELEDAFYKNLSFGTGGMRGVLGPGTNRMNIYTIRKAVAGLAKYIKSNVQYAENRGVAIAYDSRHMSKEFAVEAAKVLGAEGVKIGRAHV